MGLAGGDRGRHANPQVQALWADFFAACEYVPIGSVAEGSQLFSEFAPRDDLAGA